ncbi:MAG TPA: trypsin-like peptidase domain-containing protein [Candidatus Methylomirabilis sp.]|nr:trypsin-like peptidase domain-containing protein [Candidatus Methylomirabilis sp.]
MRPWRGESTLWLLSILGALALLPALAIAGEVTPDRYEEIVAARINRVLPGVVGILTDVSAEVSVRCGKNDTYVVKPEPDRENGTGFIIHPDGWIATNGHVVKPVHKDDDEHIANFLEQAAKAACGPGLAKLPEKRRQARMEAILKDPENRNGVKLIKKLEVYLPTGEARQGLPAVVKAYSPPIDPDLLPKGEGKPDPPMLDAALIKVEATNLPTVRLAPSIGQAVALGQQVIIVGFPGVVVWHDFLSKKSRAEATITFGRVSAFRLDVNERWILQTDASISWGNSGGPAFDVKGEVVALATFISTSMEGDQAIQGFNFLIPIDSIHALAKQVGMAPSSDSPFTREWNQAVDAFVAGNLPDALAHAEAADRIVPGLIDVRRAIVRIRGRMEQKP